MAVNKRHHEFHALDMTAGWETPAGYPAGIAQKILAGELDEVRKLGSRTRLLRFAPGVFTTAPFVHEYWEEVYLVSGDLTVGNDARGEGGTPFAANTYAVRRRARTLQVRARLPPPRNPLLRSALRRIAQRSARMRSAHSPMRFMSPGLSAQLIKSPSFIRRGRM